MVSFTNNLLSFENSHHGRCGAHSGNYWRRKLRRWI